MWQLYLPSLLHLMGNRFLDSAVEAAEVCLQRLVYFLDYQGYGLAQPEDKIFQGKTWNDFTLPMLQGMRSELEPLMNARRAGKLLVVMAKAPIPGEVKTRLFPYLSPQEAALVYRHFLLDTLLEVGTIPGIDTAIAFTPAKARGIFLPLVGDRFSLFSQRGKDLGERLCNIFEDKMREGYGAISIINSDSPDLPRHMVQESFHLLSSNRADVVFGPCDDGGYYLVGMKRVIPELFIGIPWSTDRVLPISLEKAEKMAIKTELLPRWNDIDTFEELMAFYRRYKDKPPTGPWAGEKTLSLLCNLDRFVGWECRRGKSS